MGEMAAMVAHEFNNILTPMHTYAQLARNGDESLRDRAVRLALEGSARAAGICQALLDLAGPDRRGPQKVPLAALVDETLQAMGRDLAKDGILFIKNVPARMSVTTRPGDLKQVLLNLLLNARQAVLDKGRGESIAVTAVSRDGEVLIHVADTGIGVAPENMHRIFQPFFTTRRGKGTGLGLPVCRQILRSLGGRVTVRSQQGKGSCFTIHLPGNGARRTHRRPASAPAARSAQRRRVLQVG